MRTFGVEEELLLLRECDNQPAAVASQVIAREQAMPSAGSPALVREMQQEMIEVVSQPCVEAESLFEQIVDGRARADRGAADVGARAVPLAASPVPASPHTTQSARYLEMRNRFGVTASRSLSCGQHVHVSIDSRQEGVAVLDGIRIWLPLILALSSNSAIVDGEDTGYASYRFQSWSEWATAGAYDPYGSIEAYDVFQERLLQTGVPMDPGMLYADARLSRNHPTVEVRIADVCMDPRDSLVIAVLVRALVDTAARKHSDDTPPADVPARLLRLAAWKAAKEGVGGDVLHPAAFRPVSAPEAMHALLEHVQPSLIANHDADIVNAGVARILAEGTGADRQRRAFAAGSAEAVITTAIAVQAQATTPVAEPTG
jgi:carboxylate-amine ligase